VDRNDIIVDALAGLAPMQKTVHENGLGAREEQHRLGFAHLHDQQSKILALACPKGQYQSFEFFALRNITREPVDQKAALPRNTHGSLQQSNGNVHRHNLSVMDASIDQLTVFGASPVSFLAEKISSG
jgi:hypothetical protein